jgi:hypothetical protein
LALPPDASTEVFMREVDDEVRRDRATEFWKRWGVLLGVAVLLALAAFGGYLYWQHRQVQAAGAEGEQLQSAFDQLAQNQVKQAEPKIAALAKSDNGAYRALAQFTQADILLQRQDLRGAAQRFAAVAGDAAIAQPFRDLALVRQTAAEFDTLRPQVVVERMRPLAVPGGAYLGSAGEMLAVAQLRLGQRAAAGQMFTTISSDTTVPESIRQRAVQMAGVLSVGAPTSQQATPKQDSNPK